MVTGYKTPEIADVRQRIEFISRDMTLFNQILADAQKAQDLHKDPFPLYSAARDLLVAMTEDRKLLAKIINDTQPQLEPNSSGFYQMELNAITNRLIALEDLILQPLPPAGAENTGKVQVNPITGAPIQKEDPSFEGVCNYVEDGDTISVAGRYLRIAGIDAWEGGTDRGKLATDFATNMLLNKQVQVLVDFNSKYDLYGRWLGVVMVDGKDFGYELIKACLAKPTGSKFKRHHFVDMDAYEAAAKQCVWGWPLQGECHITSGPSGAAIFVDGIDVHAVTPSKIMIDVGDHEIMLVKEGYSALRDTINVENRKMSVPPFGLIPLPASTGTIVVDVQPVNVNAVVYINGAVQGKSPVIMEVSVLDPVEIEVKADGYNVANATAWAMLGRIIRVTVPLSPSSSQQSGSVDADAILTMQQQGVVPVVAKKKSRGRSSTKSKGEPQPLGTASISPSS